MTQLPISAREIVRYIPRADRDKPAEEQRVFLLQVPTQLARAQWRRDVTAQGAGDYPLPELMLAALRAAIPAIVAEEQQAELLAIIDRWDETREGDRTAEDVARMAEIERVVGSRDAAYSDLRAQRDYHVSVSLVCAFQRFVSGWENVTAADGTPIPFAAKGGLVDERAMAMLSEHLIQEVGNAIGNLAMPSEAQRKNSGSPSP